jgi:hypothetical protein
MTAISPVPVQAMECIQGFIIPPLVVGFRPTEILISKILMLHLFPTTIAPMSSQASGEFRCSTWRAFHHWTHL